MPAEQPKKKKKGERADGRIQVRVNIGRDERGKIKYKYFYGKTIKEANEKADKWKAELINYGSTLDSSNSTVSEWVDHVLKVFIEPSSSLSTYRMYRSLYTNHIKSMTCKVKDVRKSGMQQFFNTKKQYSKNTLIAMHSLLHQSFERAIDDNIIRVNPLKGVKLPLEANKVKTVDVLTIEEQKAYIEACESVQDGFIFFFCLYTGCRIGEAMVLKWENINLDKREIYIVDHLKTKSSMRTIPICDILYDKLQSISDKEGLVFHNSKGNQFQYPWLYGVNCDICNAANIRHIKIHTTRHTFATRLIEQGVDIKTVSELLGHTNINITLSTYAHSTNDTKAKAVQKLCNIM